MLIKPKKKLVPAKTLTDAVYSQLREDIIQGELKPDSKLKIEQLRKHYSVGATPIREALSRLSSDGLTTTEGQRGFRVLPISLEDLADVTEVRIILELKALRESILKGTGDWESRVVASFYQLSKYEQPGGVKDLATWDKCNHEFHQALISACTSRWLKHFYRILYDQHKRYRNISLLSGERLRNVHSEHKEIYDAALARDVKTACDKTEQHIRSTAEITRKILHTQIESNQ